MMRSRSARFGVSVSPARITVAMRGAPIPTSSQSYPVPPATTDEPFVRIGETLTDALWKTRTALGIPQATIVVALLPPLARCRVIDMRGLHDDEIQSVLTRDVGSYFPVGATPHVIGGARVRHGASRTSAVLATAAPTALIDTIYDAAASAGCSVRAIVPAAAAWAAAVERVWAVPRAAASTLVAALDGHVDVLTVERGQLTAVRRLRGVPPDHRPVIDALGANAEVMLVGAPQNADSVARSLKASGARLTAPVRDPELTDTPDTLAAVFASDAVAGPVLLPEPVRAERRQRATRRAVRVLIASAGLVAGAGALELWGVERELAAVNAERADLRGRLVGALATRDTVAMLAEQLSALRSAEMSAPRWSEALALVAEHLPRDAHLLSLRAEADSLLLEGVAHRAASVFEAMARAPAALAVRAHGSIRQEVRDDVGQVERFTLSVRLTRDAP